MGSRLNRALKQWRHPHSRCVGSPSGNRPVCAVAMQGFHSFTSTVDQQGALHHTDASVEAYCVALKGLRMLEAF